MFLPFLCVIVRLSFSITAVVDVVLTPDPSVGSFYFETVDVDMSVSFSECWFDVGIVCDALNTQIDILWGDFAGTTSDTAISYQGSFVENKNNNEGKKFTCVSTGSDCIFYPVLLICPFNSLNPTPSANFGNCFQIVLDPFYVTEGTPGGSGDGDIVMPYVDQTAILLGETIYPWLAFDCTASGMGLCDLFMFTIDGAPGSCVGDGGVNAGNDGLIFFNMNGVGEGDTRALANNPISCTPLTPGIRTIVFNYFVLPGTQVTLTIDINVVEFKPFTVHSVTMQGSGYNGMPVMGDALFIDVDITCDLDTPLECGDIEFTMPDGQVLDFVGTAIAPGRSTVQVFYETVSWYYEGEILDFSYTDYSLSSSELTALGSFTVVGDYIFSIELDPPVPVVGRPTTMRVDVLVGNDAMGVIIGVSNFQTGEDQLFEFQVVSMGRQILEQTVYLTMAMPNGLDVAMWVITNPMIPSGMIMCLSQEMMELIGGEISDGVCENTDYLSQFTSLPTSPPYMAYNLPSQITTGNTAYEGSLGLDFVVESPIVISKFGAFDHSRDGFANGVRIDIWSGWNSCSGPDYTCNVYNLFTDYYPPGPSYGEMYDYSAYRMFTLPYPLTLSPGSYTLVAHGYGASELYYRSDAEEPGKMTDDGVGLLSFYGVRHSDTVTTQSVFPHVAETGDSQRYCGPTFEFFASINGCREYDYSTGFCTKASSGYTIWAGEVVPCGRGCRGCPDGVCLWRNKPPLYHQGYITTQCPWSFYPDYDHLTCYSCSSRWGSACRKCTRYMCKNWERDDDTDTLISKILFGRSGPENQL